MKRLFSILVIFLSVGGLAFAAAAGEFQENNLPVSSSNTPVPVTSAKGSAFMQVTNAGGIRGSRFYLYVPSELYKPGPMITPVIYVYGNNPYPDGFNAWDALTAAGLDKIAEAEHAAVIMVNPVNQTAGWGKADIDVFEAIMDYINFANGQVKLTWHSLQYVIGEGSGATFVNNYLTQNCKRIAAVMTFGGSIGTPYPLYPLPAYIVSGSQAAVDFYININDGTPIVPTSGRVQDVIDLIKGYWQAIESTDKTTHVYTANPVKKVIVSKKAATALDAALIADCWESLFRYTTKADLITNFWQYFPSNTYNDAAFTLLARPNYKAAGMKVVKVDGIDNGIWESNADNYWYEFIPKAVQEAMAANSDKKFPLFLCLHGGGDHPIYEAESIGWSQLCIDQDIIMVSPNATAGGRTPEATAELSAKMMKLVDYMIKKYPVDTSRIYAAGFSGGASSTLAVSNAYPERFAAVSAMSCVAGPFYKTLLSSLPNYNYDIDLPVGVIGQGMETESTNFDGEYVWFDAVQGIYQLNEIEQYTGRLDYTRYPYWGFPIRDEIRYNPPTGFAIWRGFSYDDKGIPLVFFAHTEQTTHTHYPEYAPIIWDWFKRFSRDTVTKALIYAP
jgi:poly(3-hydroxybutyrate) depolymerase